MYEGMSTATKEKTLEEAIVDLGCTFECNACEKFFVCKSPEKWKVYKRRRMAKATERLKHTKYKIAVTGGKGGVGKTLVTVNLAAALAMRGYKVAVLDQDFDGRAVPKMFGVLDKDLEIGPKGIEPVVYEPLNIKIVSAGNMRRYKGDGILTWFFKLRQNATEEFLSNTNWGENDFLIIDLPPGTGADAINVMVYIPDTDGMIDVTVPSIPSQGVAKRAALLALNAGIRVLGIVENMSDFICPKCETATPVFQKGGADALSRELNLPILGRIPLDPRISRCCDEGKVFVYEYPDTPTGKAILSIADKTAELVKEGKKA
jgi:ATP-binding protein involved in chromosome partitioning